MKNNQQGGEGVKDIDDLVFIIAVLTIAIVCFIANPIFGFMVLGLGLLFYGIGSGAFDN